MKSRVQEAVSKKRNGYNCAQAVACTYCDLAGVDDETMRGITQGLGAGMGTMEGTCGAITGAGVVMGMIRAKENETGTQPKVMPIQDSKHLMQSFKERNGCVTCKDLKGIGTGKVLRNCDDCVADAAEFVEELLK